MSSYETEHNIQPSKAPASRGRQRPDLDSFYSITNAIDTSNTQNPNAVPVPADISAAYQLLGDSLQALMRDNPDEGLLRGLLEQVSAMIDSPPERVQGVTQEFLDGLERVPKKSLKKTDECPICSFPFLDDEYPLVVRLPCHKDHKFDLDCIQPWLKLNSTCPLDRKNLLEKKKPPPPPKEEEEEDYDDMYA